MGRKKDGQFWLSAMQNKGSFIQYYNRLVELSVSMFEWKNVPDTIDARFLELTLFERGQALFFKDDVIGELALPFTMNSGYNVYRIPIGRRAYANNGYQASRDINNSVIIYNNYLRTNSKLDVEIFAHRLWDLDRTIEVNARAQKTPVLITCEEQERLSLENLYMKYDGNEPVIFAQKGLNPDSLKVLRTDAPYVGDKLYNLKVQIWNEALTYLGIPNVNYEKRERLVTDEVLRSQGGVTASRCSRLEMRKQACKEINKMFGLDMDVDFRDVVGEFEQDVPEKEGAEG